MSRSAKLLVGCVIMVAASAAQAASNRPVDTIPAAATPAGILLVEPERQRGLRPVGSQKVLNLADTQGRLLHTYKKDERLKSNCVDECATQWLPAAAPPAAKPMGDWAILVRADRSGQWTYHGRPLYIQNVSAKTSAPRAQENFEGGPPREPQLPDGWSVATYEPAPELLVPGSAYVDEILDASGWGLVDLQGMTLYTFNARKRGEMPCAKATLSCEAPWIPFEAPEAAHAIGRFDAVVQADGTRQWTYGGKPLFRFSGDLVPGDAYGNRSDERFAVALVYKYFTPPGVTIQRLAVGDVLVNADGKALYTRHVHRHQIGNRYLPHGVPRPYSAGKTLGTGGCDARCLKEWRPFVARAQAQPSGFWEILDRPDGTKQWAYKGYALYTFSGDTAPGEVNGHEKFDFLTGENGRMPVDNGRGSALALVWRDAEP